MNAMEVVIGINIVVAAYKVAKEKDIIFNTGLLAAWVSFSILYFKGIVM